MIQTGPNGEDPVIEVTWVHLVPLSYMSGGYHSAMIAGLAVL